jgi:1,2-diacylglycerol 3-alpha-glucosyltransferase
VGDGPDHDEFRALARRLGVEDRTFFPGEFPVTEMVNWYQHADLFVYTSLSETYGQVVSEALWCGLPVVALADGMGVSQQIVDGQSGILVQPGPDPNLSNWRFGSEVLGLLRHGERRARLGAAGAAWTREHCAPERGVAAYYSAFRYAKEHLERARSLKKGSRARGALAHWSGVHAFLALLGCLRAPAVVNRHGRRQPGWEELFPASETLNPPAPDAVEAGQDLPSVGA